jgi:hypothetical protein
MTTFHFALNNTVVHDNRIPPYKMNQATAIERNAAPVPPDEYPVDASGNYPYFDEVHLNPPSGAVAANIRLLYQPTSWEYIQFLYEANKESSGFLGQEGRNILDAWLDRDGEMEHSMAEPIVMAAATWGDAEPGCDLSPPTLDSAVAGQGQVTLDWSGPSEGDITDYSLYYDQSDKTQLVANLICADVDCTTYTDTGLTNTNELCYVVTAHTTDCESGFSNMLCATPQPPGQTPYASVSVLETGHWVREGKGKHATETFVVTNTFSPGDQVIVRLAFNNNEGQTVTGAVSTLAVIDAQTGNLTASLTSGSSDGSGLAEAAWSTQSPNKKGQGGTPEGDYTLHVTGMTSSNYEWDGVENEVTIRLGSGLAGSSAMDCMHHCD